MINHKQILSNLNSYKNLYELTKAIQLVAMSKLSALRKKEENRALLPSYLLVSKKINSAQGDTLIVPITTDRSCCGSINNNIMETVKYYTQVLKSTYYLFVVGKKGVSLSKKFHSTEFLYNLTEVTKYNLSVITMTILMEKLQEFDSELSLSNYILIYNYFKNIVSQDVSSVILDTKNSFITNIPSKLSNFSYLNNVLENKHSYFTSDLYDYLLFTVLIKVLYENEMSEYGARASSMRNASKNAEELIAKLQLQYNKARQTHITNELIEIISCVNSIMSGDNLDKYSFYLQFVHE